MFTVCPKPYCNWALCNQHFRGEASVLHIKLLTLSVCEALFLAVWGESFTLQSMDTLHTGLR